MRSSISISRACPPSDESLREVRSLRRLLPVGPMRDSDLLFPSTTGRWRSPTCLDKPIRRIALAAGITKHLSAKFIAVRFKTSGAPRMFMTWSCVRSAVTPRVRCRITTAAWHPARCAMGSPRSSRSRDFARRSTAASRLPDRERRAEPPFGAWARFHGDRPRHAGSGSSGSPRRSRSRDGIATSAGAGASMLDASRLDTAIREPCSFE